MNCRIGVDVDGVLAKFEPSFIPLLNAVAGGRITCPRDYKPQCWDWPAAAGFTLAEERAAWDALKADDGFWSDLEEAEDVDPFVTFIEEELDPNVDVYFITNRPGLGAKLCTEGWLCALGFSNPTVIISPYKAKICSALDITHYIDDKVENCQAVSDEGCSKVFMRAQAWNRELPGIPRGDLAAFAQVIRGQ